MALETLIHIGYHKTASPGYRLIFWIIQKLGSKDFLAKKILETL